MESLEGALGSMVSFCLFGLFLVLASAFDCTWEVSVTVDNFLQSIHIGSTSYTGTQLGGNWAYWPAINRFNAAGSFIAIEGELHSPFSLTC